MARLATMSAGAVVLPLVLLALLPLVAAQRVFFSKYIHGSATVTRALELYNPSCSSVALSEFKVRMQPCSAALYWVLFDMFCSEHERHTSACTTDRVLSEWGYVEFRFLHHTQRHIGVTGKAYCPRQSTGVCLCRW